MSRNKTYKYNRGERISIYIPLDLDEETFRWINSRVKPSTEILKVISQVANGQLVKRDYPQSGNIEEILMKLGDMIKLQAQPQQAENSQTNLKESEAKSFEPIKDEITVSEIGNSNYVEDFEKKIKDTIQSDSNNPKIENEEEPNTKNKFDNLNKGFSNRKFKRSSLALEELDNDNNNSIFSRKK